LGHARFADPRIGPEEIGPGCSTTFLACPQLYRCTAVYESESSRDKNWGWLSHQYPKVFYKPSFVSAFQPGDWFGRRRREQVEWRPRGLKLYHLSFANNARASNLRRFNEMTDSCIGLQSPIATSCYEEGSECYLLAAAPSTPLISSRRLF
jgi:hypothetical protein